MWASINVPVPLFEEFCARPGGASVKQLRCGEVPMLRAQVVEPKATHALETVILPAGSRTPAWRSKRSACA